MKKTSILRILLLSLISFQYFTIYSQNLVAYGLKGAKEFDAVFFTPSYQFKSQFGAHSKNISVRQDASEIVNPVIKYAQSPYVGVVSRCPNDGSMLPKLFLCGLNDSRLIQTGITDAVFITWQRRTGGCASFTRGNCPNKDSNCTWADVGEGADYAASSSGEFRIKIRNKNNTESVFYFNVYKNELDPNGITKSDIINGINSCTIPGQIIAGGLGSGYEYSCTTNPVPNEWQDSNMFSIINPGSYNIFIRLKGVDGGCIFNVKNIVVRSVNFTSALTAAQPLCSGEKGIIKVTANAVNRQLKYAIYKGQNTAPLSTVGPVSLSEFEFTGLDAGSYRVVSSVDGTCATDEQSIKINSLAKIVNNSYITQALTVCANGLIKGAATGGTAPYRYSVNADDAGFQVISNGIVTVKNGGTYIMRVEDVNGCIIDKKISIPAVTKPEYTITSINGKCGENSSIEVKLTKDNGFNLEYSKDNGVNFINGNGGGVIFSNLTNGQYAIVVRYTKTGVNNGSSCSDNPHIINIGATTPLTASAGIGSLSGCGPDSDAGQGIARITNPQGGTPFPAPNLYLYSFDNQKSWITKNEGYIKPGGPYSVFIKDAAGCVYEMAGLKLDPKPAPPVITMDEPVYNCDGTANSSVRINDGLGNPKYAYKLYLDGNPNPNTADPNMFLNVSPGDHYITVDYSVLTVSTYSNLLDESFGSGENTTSPGINSFYYCFERQLPGQPETYCNGSYAINDGDYSVTSSINKAITSTWGWRYPKDHTSNGTDPKGRFLAVNIGSQIPETTVLYEKQINDVIPNQPINFDFYAMNLMMPGAGNEDPNLRIALVDANGEEISWFATGPIARSVSDTDWKHFPETPIALNPGNNNSLRLIIRSNVRKANGNDVAIDDIKVFQIPKTCGAQSLFKIKVNSNKVFNARVENSSPVKCVGESSGALSIYAENFSDTFQYSIDGQPWISSAVSPVLVSGLKANPYSVKVRYNDKSPDCDFDIPAVVTSVETFLVEAAATVATCSDGASVTARATGGTAPYSFVLKDSAGKETPFLSDGNAGGILKKIPPGNYVVIGMDKNSCSNNSQQLNLVVAQSDVAQLTIDETKKICFDGSNGTAITIAISGGKEPFTYSVSQDGGIVYDAFRPSFSDREFTFTAPAGGTYDFIVMDANGCKSSFNIIIDDQISAKSVLTKDITCGAFPQNAARIEVSVKGGTEPFGYRVKSNGGTFNGPPVLFEGKTFEYSPAASGSYTFEITDSKGCTEETEALAVKDPEIVTVTYISTDPVCNGNSDGTILFTAITGTGPFRYSIDSGQTFQDSYKFGGLSAGTYNYAVKDSNGCIAEGNAVLANPSAVTLDIHTNGIACGPLKPGSFDVRVSGGGKAPYIYYLYDNAMNVIDSYTATTAGDAAVMHNFPNLSFGDYFMTAVDINGCEFKSSKLRIEPPPYLDLSGTIIGNTCVEGISVALKVTGGTGPDFTYNILGTSRTSGSITSAVYTFDKLEQNMTYVFEVLDSNGCPSYLEVKTPSISNLIIDSIVTKQVTCYGAANGEVTFTVSQYSASELQYEIRDNLTNKEVSPSLSGSVYGLTGNSFTGTIKGLKPGNYSLYIKETDGTSCSISQIFKITQPTLPLSAQITSINNANCHMGALITLKASGGTGPYLYATAVSPAIPSLFDNSNVLELGKPETNWNILVKDANGCIFALSHTTATDSSPAIALSIVDKCASQNEFAIRVIETSAGKGPYSLKMDNGVFTPIKALPYNITGLSSGNHTITLKDANECTDTKSIKIDSPIKVIASVSVLPGCEVNNGEILLAPSGGSSSYNYSISPMHPGIIVKGNKITGLIADNYTITMTDIQNHCTAIAEVSLSPASPVKFEAQGAKATCKGAQDGSISVRLSNDNNNPPYTYSISGGLIASVSDQSSSEFTDLPAGSYTIEVKSGRGCKVKKIIDIAEPDQIEIKPTITKYSCKANNNGFTYARITADNVKGGAGPGNYVAYQFFRDGIEVQNGSSNTHTEYDYKGGSYTINVYDKNNCMGTSEAVAVEPFTIMESLKINRIFPITCENLESVKAVVNIKGTASSLQYHLTGIENTVADPQTNSTGEFSGLGIGDYLITAEDTGTGCSIAEYYHVFAPNTFEIQVQSANAEICYGENAGSIELILADTKPVPTNDSWIYDYIITGPMPAIYGSSDNSGPVKITGLMAGEYTVTAKLKSGSKCEVRTGFHIVQPLSKLDIELQYTAVSCKSGYNDGTITATAKGGWTDRAYQYELIGPIAHIYSDVYHFDNLTPGHYIVNIKDSKGCIATAAVDLLFPEPIKFTAAAVPPVLSCYGDDSAIILISNTSGGIGSHYAYTLNYTLPAGDVISIGPQSSNEFKGLFSGNYSVIVTDGFSCEKVSDIITISNPVKLQVELSQNTEITCASDATFTLTASGGKSPYVYSEDGTNYGTSFNSSITFSAKPGLHQYWVKDSLGCISEKSGALLIDPLVPLSVELDLKYAKVNCKGEAGAMIIAESKGGMGDYRYSLLDRNGAEIRTAQTNGLFDSLSGEESPYTVLVRSGDCQINSVAVKITEPEAALTSAYSISSVSCFGGNDGIIDLVAQGGTGRIKYAISPNLDMFVESGKFERLPKGTYTVIAVDIVGCSNIYRDIKIEEPAFLTVSEIPNSKLPEICKGDKNGAFFIEINGGTAPYFESLDNEKGPYFPVNGFVKDYLNQTGGKHTVYIKDNKGCTSEREVIMPEPAVLNPAIEIQYECVDNRQYSIVTVTVDSSNTDTLEVDYSLDSDQGPWQSNNIFTNLAPGSHYLIARHTNGCTAKSKGFEIRPYNPLTVALSEQDEMNVISVRADGGIPEYEFSVNGRPFTSSSSFKIYESGNYDVTVRDRNGCTKTITVHGVYVDVCISNYFTPNGDGVYDTWGPGCTDIYNKLEFSIFDRYGRLIGNYHYGQKWDGKYKGAEMPSGDYWYVLKLNDEKDRRKFSGHVTLFR
ncbi:hypothetical protein B0A81_18685 [Flavobacterium plurextorum]|uniref:Gliding motility-associated C-terminal domain-containing protein n=1 Tax=Flavobacterium plurextorum TaxID=1114867 RepID=A0ABX4CPU8_9FLAO|nr:T9SS type B sorting domain-containing protein [Flavobacterium plurextorum]OXB03358.1 hypothetical protein B0A81_18685 [Flavobacterium plurextorum]